MKCVACLDLHVAIELDTEVDVTDPAVMAQVVKASFEANEKTGALVALLRAQPGALMASAMPAAVVDRGTFDAAKAGADAEEAQHQLAAMPTVGGMQ